MKKTSTLYMLVIGLLLCISMSVGCLSDNVEDRELTYEETYETSVPYTSDVPNAVIDELNNLSNVTRNEFETSANLKSMLEESGDLTDEGDLMLLVEQYQIGDAACWAYIEHATTNEYTINSYSIIAAYETRMLVGAFTKDIEASEVFYNQIEDHFDITIDRPVYPHAEFNEWAFTPEVEDDTLSSELSPARGTSGEWTGTFIVQENMANPGWSAQGGVVLNIKQDGNDITGTYTIEEYRSGTVSGTMSSSKISFTDGFVRFDGMYTDDHMKLNVESCSCNQYCNDPTNTNPNYAGEPGIVGTITLYKGSDNLMSDYNLDSDIPDPYAPIGVHD